MPNSPAPKLGHVTEKALALLRKHPAGLSMRQMREMTGSTDSQEHFNRRVRDIRKYYVLERRKKDGVDIYVLGKRKTKQTSGSGAISEKLRAEVMHAAHGKCQMCGSSIAKDGVKLQADHRLPQSWGGKTVRENLWAICEACNRGKKHFFSSFDKKEMRKVLSLKSVHERIAQMLRLHMNKPVPAYVLEFVANALDQQEDWHRRLRELRSPVIGLKIEVTKKRGKKGVESFYTLKNWRSLPANTTAVIRAYERRKEKNAA